MRQILLFLACVLSSNMFAQELTVKRMEAQPMDLSASQYERKDYNGTPCALVKVQLAAFGAKFEGNVMGDVSYNTGEYWVYMTEGSRELRIKHPNYLPLHITFNNYGIAGGVKSKLTYNLVVVKPAAYPANDDDGTSYLIMTVSPKNSIVFIDDKLQTVSDGTMRIRLSYGQHRYRVDANGYATEQGVVDIGPERKDMNITLQSRMVTLSVNCATLGVQIYVNDQLKGPAPWSGQLPPGTYVVEGRKQGSHPQRETINLTERSDRTITLPALIAQVGSLDVDYQPLNAEVYLDGQLLGKSPNVFRNVMVGSHNVELRASGYTSKQDRITIEEGKTALLSGALEREPAAQPQTSATPASGSSVETITVNGVSFNMIRVDGGLFTMGATSEQGSDAFPDEIPAHQVTLDTFSIGETEVTQALWEAVMGKNPSEFKGNRLPVESVCWKDCQNFIEKLNKKTGLQFRLPTEAEWEYAARGGNKSQGYKYCGSNNIDDVAWYDSNSSQTTHDVKTKQANELGIYDMSGNVREWCQDRYGSYSADSQMNPTGASSGSFRVIRGGSWDGYAGYCRVAFRRSFSPDLRYGGLGLRLALK